jgi:hypothetical protein
MYFQFKLARKYRKLSGHRDLLSFYPLQKQKPQLKFAQTSSSLPFYACRILLTSYYIIRVMDGFSLHIDTKEKSFWISILNKLYGKLLTGCNLIFKGEMFESNDALWKERNKTLTRDKYIKWARRRMEMETFLMTGAFVVESLIKASSGGAKSEWECVDVSFIRKFYYKNNFLRKF